MTIDWKDTSIEFLENFVHMHSASDLGERVIKYRVLLRSVLAQSEHKRSAALLIREIVDVADKLDTPDA